MRDPCVADGANIRLLVPTSGTKHHSSDCRTSSQQQQENPAHVQQNRLSATMAKEPALLATAREPHVEKQLQRQ
jgi:hypothetical protein